MSLSKRCTTTLLTLAVITSCMTGGDKQSGDNNPDKPVAVAAKVNVASVQMIQDCPDTEVEAEAGAAAKRAPHDAMEPPASEPSPGSAVGSVVDGGFQQPCDQSTVQLAIEATSGPVTIEIEGARLLADGKRVGKLTTRKPKIWLDNSYQTWDQRVEPGAPIKASYKLSMPDWDAVETKIGKTSYDHMFTLELDIAVDGKRMTVTSPAFPREQQHVIAT